MTKKNVLFDELYQTIHDWINDVKNNELTHAIEIIEQAKTYVHAAEAIPEEKVSQFIESFRYDLVAFYHHNQSQAKHSLYLGLINETFWKTLATMTDKSQVEWSELIEDFQHDGFYFTGDYIGFGELECCQCATKLTITHSTKISSCINCHSGKFIRHGLMP